MRQQNYLPSISQTRTPDQDSDRLFSGLLPRWSILTQTEKVVCLLVALTPLWWLLGWKHFMFLIGIGLIAYEKYSRGEVRLRRPSVAVIGFLAFCVYSLISKYFYALYHHNTLSPNAILSQLNSWIGPAIILWYIQSKNLRVRWQIVAWAFSVVVALMVVLWAVIFFVWHQAYYDPPRSLYGFLTGKSRVFVPGAGNSNYLMPYFPTDEAILPGLVRYVYFFPGPESLALTVGFTSLLALDLKNRLWSVLLFSASIFILLTSGTRSVVLTLPLVLCLRYLLTAGQTFGLWFLCGLIAVTSFTTLSIPPVTNIIFNSVVSTAEAAGEARADSTEVRGEIYRRTIDGIVNSSNTVFLLGHVKTGEGVLPGYAPAVVGSHSFLLGTLLYRSGVIGTSLFAISWISLILWLYKTKSDRPMAGLLIFIIFSLTFCVMECELPVMPISLLCVLMQKSPKQLNFTKI
ncbi:MAG: hypothetical protein F6K63_00340 [Moorea sp. SIO1G6]|uniref:hypothetical protein n=1 Tax=Moorena sp. SIO1G6 TaxID=2607840 RepID=UPI0013C08487|nr:hypothetical protein [Moorena sp. SIO1G6]NET62923.1 hypothetical protein [Moorena sp. SIO1G6]